MTGSESPSPTPSGSSPKPDLPLPRPSRRFAPQRLGAAFARSKVRHVITWPRIRSAIAIALLVFVVLRIVLGLVLNYALTRATEATLGLKCRVGSSTLNLADGQAILSDVALLGSSGTPIATMARAELDLSWTSLPNLIVERLAIEDVDLYVKRDSHGQLPALEGILGGKKAAAPPPAEPSVKAVESKDAPAKPAAPLPIVLLKRMRVHHILVHWEDERVKPTFKGELLLDMRGDEIATFPRPTPPSFSLKLTSPGVLDTFRLDVAGRTLEDGASEFDVVVEAQAHPSAIASYFGPDVQICAQTLALAIEGYAYVRPALLDSGRYYTGQLSVERAKITAGDDVVDLGRIMANLTRFSRDGIDFSAVTMDHPRISFGRLSDGTLRVLGFGLRGKGKKGADAPVEPSEAARLPVIKVQEMALHAGKLHFRDESEKTPATIDIEYQGRVQDVLLDPESTGRRAKIEATCSMPGIVDKATVTGTFVPVGTQRDLAVDLVADGIGLTAIKPYLKAVGLEPDLKRGTASASVHAQALAVAGGGLSFSAEVTKARYADQEEILTLRALRVEGGQVGADGSVTVDRVAIEDPQANIRRHRSGALSVAGIRTVRVDPNEPVAAAPAETSEETASAEAAPPAKKSKVVVHEVALTGGKIGWRDDAFPQPVQLALEGGSITIMGIALGDTTSQPATMRATARLRPSIGEVTVEASLFPDPGAPSISGSMTARDVSYKPLAPYLKALGIEPTLERGRLEAGLQAKAKFHGPALADARVVLAPLSLKMGVEELASVASIELKNTSVDPAARATNFGDLTITGVRARAFRDSQGNVRMLGLKIPPRGPESGGEAAVSSAAPAAVAPPSRSRRGSLRMGEIALRDVAFSWHDELTQPASDVRLDRLDVTLGARRLDIEPKAGDPPTPLKVHAEVYRLANLDIDAGIQFIARSPSVKADLKLSDVTLSALRTYLRQAGYASDFKKGRFFAHLETQLTFDQAITSALIDLTQLKLDDGGKELLGLDSMKFFFELDSERRTFRTNEITLASPRVVAGKTKDGDLLACGLIIKKAPEGAPAAAPPPAPAPAAKGPAEKPLTTTIDGVKVDGLALDWRDASAGDAHLAIKKGWIDVGPIRPGRKTQTPWKLKGDLGNLGELSMSGVATLTTKTIAEGELRLEKMNGREISPYLGEGTTLDLDNGTFALKLNYFAEPVPAGGQKMVVTLSQVALEEKGTLLLGWDSLKADLGRSDPVKQVYVIDALELAGLRGEVTKLPEGRSRSFGFDKRPVPVAATPKARKIADAATLADPPPLPSVELKKLALGASTITVRDRTDPNAGEPPPYLIKNLLLSNTAPFVLQSDDPTTAVLDLVLKAESGGAYELASATFHAIPFDAEPQARLEIDLKGLSGDAIAKRSPELARKYDLSAMKSGVAHLGLSFAIKSHERLDMLGQSPAPLAFELGIDGFDVRSRPDGPVLLGVDEIRMDVSAYDLATGAMTVRKLEVNNPVGAFATESGGFRALDILTKNEPPAAANGSDANVPSKPPEPAAKAPLQRYETITVSDGDIGYIDSTLKPLLDFRMSSFEVELTGYSNEWRTSKKPMGILIRSRGGSYDDFKIKGKLAFAPRLEGDFEARILGLPLDKISGYCERSSRFVFTRGRLDIETRGSFKKGVLKTTGRVTLMDADTEVLDDCKYPIIGSLTGLADANGEIQLEVPIEFELDENLKFVEGSTKMSIGGLLGEAASLALKATLGAAIDNLTGGKKEVVKTDQASRRKPPVPFGPVETRLPDESKPMLDELAAKLKAEPLFYVSLRGMIGRDDDRRAKVLASPAPGDRRDLIARMEAERARLERRRADAISEVRGALQAGTDDLGRGRSHLTEVTARLQKLDKSLENLYEQEREGAERSADRRTREIEAELCENRVESVRAYLVSKGAPVERVKSVPGRLKPGDQEKGIVAIESWTARRESIKKDATKHEAAPAK